MSKSTPLFYRNKKDGAAITCNSRAGCVIWTTGACGLKPCPRRGRGPSPFTPCRPSQGRDSPKKAKAFFSESEIRALLCIIIINTYIHSYSRMWCCSRIRNKKYHYMIIPIIISRIILNTMRWHNCNLKYTITRLHSRLPM